MSLAEQIGRWMSLRAPQRESLARLHAIVEAVDFKTAPCKPWPAIFRRE